MLRTFTDTTNVGGQEMGGHRLWTRTGTQFAMPSTRASRGRSGRSCAHKSVGRTTAVILRHPSASRRVKTLWKVRDAEEKGCAYDDHDSERQIVSRDAVRQGLWEKHLQKSGDGPWKESCEGW